MQSLRAPLARHAGVAQLVEQLTCNEKVEGSIPFTGTISTQQKAQPNGRAFLHFAPGQEPDPLSRGFRPLPAQPSAGNILNSSTITRPTTATMDCTTEIVLVASPIVMPKDSFTIQNPA